MQRAVRNKRKTQAKLQVKQLTSFDKRLIELERRVNGLAREVREYKIQYSEPSKQFQNFEYLIVELVEGPILVDSSWFCKGSRGPET